MGRGFRPSSFRTARLAAFVIVGFAGCRTTTDTPWPTVEGGTPSYAACTTAGQCLARVPGCCGTCGAPTLADVAGVNRDRLSEFQAATCRDGGVACPKCAQAPEPNLIALCLGGACTPIDLRKDSFSECRRDEDCRLRYAECCEPCAPRPDEVVAVATASLSLYELEMCGPNRGCDACAPAFPERWSAACGTDGHCRVVPAGP